jgi:hypothetical protein
MIMIRTLIVPGANKIKLQKANFGLLLTQDEGPRGNPSEKPSNKRLEVAQKATVLLFILDLNADCQSYCIINWPMKELLAMITATDFEIECLSSLHLHLG